ncbi:MAG: ABC transporter substrate-binding protein [Eubacteriales bacterium]|nr:ABC transporter substrate-binding protein [Eubacteriales bacterium]
MKKLLTVILAVMLLMSLAACQAAPAPAPAAAEPAEAPAPAAAPEAPAAAPEQKQDITLTYMASQDWVMDAEIELGEKFTQETGIKVDYQIVPSDQYFNLLLTKLNTGECTDLFGSQAGQFDIISQLNVEKNAVDLSAEEWTTRLDPLAAAEVSVGGKVYGQPVQDASAVWAIAYNKKIFSSLNLQVPKTYAEFKAVCDAILASGVTPVYEAVSDGWHHTLWFPELGPAIEKKEPGMAAKLNGNQAKFADSATAKLIVEQIKDMVDSGYWGDNYMDNAFSDAAKYFAEGKYAMVLCQQGFPTEVNALDPNFPAEDVGYFVMPLADNQTLNMNPVVPTRFVFSGSKNIDAAKAYMAFLARPENLQYMIDNVPKYNMLPISGANDKYSDEIKAFYAAYPDHGTVFQTAVKYVNPQWMEIGKEITNVILGQNDAMTMLVNIDKNRADQAAAAGDDAWK